MIVKKELIGKKLKINMPGNEISKLIENLSGNNPGTFEILSDTALELDIKVIPFSSKIELINKQTPIGFFKPGFLADTIIFFDDSFINITPGKISLAFYNNVKPLKKTSLTGNYSLIAFNDRAEKTCLQDAIKESREAMKKSSNVKWEKSSKIVNYLIKGKGKSAEEETRDAEWEQSSKIVKDTIGDSVGYKVKYLGGYPGIERGTIFILAIEKGIFGYSKKGLLSSGPDLKELFTLPWSSIKKIEYQKEVSQNTNKSSLTTAGLLTKNKTLLAAGLLNKSENVKHFFKINLFDESGFESEMLFTAENSQNITFYLNERRMKLYKQEEVKDKVSEVGSNDNLEKLKKLKELKDLDVITEEEFNEKKKKLLEDI